MAAGIKRSKVDLDELDGILDSASEGAISSDDRDKVRKALHTMAEQLAEFHRTSEKLNKIIDEVAEKDDSGKPKEAELPKKPKPGHGRNSADTYTGAKTVSVTHPDLKKGASCPCCAKGKLSKKKPSRKVRVEAMAPITATRYDLERLRCNLCGETFTASPPSDAPAKKYDDSVAAMLAILKYGHGFPHKRLETMQKSLGVPLSASVQSELLKKSAELLKPVHKELIRYTAQSALLHADDTSMKILKIKREPDDPRSGSFTSGILGVTDAHKVALFFTGPKHAGENLAALLKHRSAELDGPVLMCDALSWNTSKLTGSDEVELAHCLAHGRRKFVAIVDSFPKECLHVLEEIGKVYVVEAKIQEQGLGPKERLAQHKLHSKPIMDKLSVWIAEQLDGKTEPNSRLGKALKYLQRHWKALTKFLKSGKAPLDNNICERAIKKTVLNRKNAFFYRTLNGAQVGDLWMSLIHTCELNDVNPFEYLVALQRNSVKLAESASGWLPWNYKEAARGSP